MASIIKRPNGCREIRVMLGGGKRPSIRLGRCDQKTAAGVCVHIERLAQSMISNTPAPMDTLIWLRDLPETLHRKMSRAGLCSPRQSRGSASPLLKTTFDEYIVRRTDWTHGTVLVFEQARNHLVKYFGADRRLDSITVGDAKDFRRLLARDYSEAYTAKMVRQARQLWRDAIERKLIAENPWSSVRCGSDRNPARQHYIDVATMSQAIDSVADPEWKLLLALARYAGLRVPSEPLALTWADVDFGTGRMVVRSRKTQRYSGKDQRVVPIFPEVRSHLEAVFKLSGAAGAIHVINRYRDANANLRTQLLRILRSAGVTPWPRLFHNLRASCQTDLVERFPAHVVCAWIGNSEVIARDHYLQVTDAHFASANGVVESGKARSQPGIQFERQT